MFGRVSGVDDKKCMSYEAHPKRASRTGLLDRIDFENKFGQLDPGRLMQELAGGKHGLDARLKAMSDYDLQDEVAALQDWQKKANGRMMTLEKRAAYAFIGMRVGTADKGAIKRAFRRKALELHPDKGGDAERFQLLQEMKDLLIEPTAKELEDKDKEEKENEKEREAESGKNKKDKEKDKDKADDKDEKKDEKGDGDEDFDDTDFSDDSYDMNEEFKKMFPEYGKKKKKKKKQDDDEWGDLGRGEEFNRDKHVAARRKLHRNMAEMWERAGKLAEEIKRNQAADSGGEALRALRKFADRFANVEISKLKENDPKKAERLFRRFLEQGSEIICAAGAVDAVATVSCIAMQVNFPLLAKAPSDDLKAKTSALLEAIEAFSGVFERHVGPVEELLGDRRKAAKEAEAAAGPVKVRMVMPDLTIMVKRGEQELPGARAAEIEMPPGSTVADLRAAALQVFGKSAARLFCGGRYLGTEKMPLAAITEIEAGAAVQCLPSNKVLPPNVAALARPKGATPLPGTAAAEGDAAAQPQLNPHALPEGGLGYPIDASASTRRGGSAAKASSKDADVQEGAPRDKKAADAKSEETEAIGKANAVVAVEREEDIKAAGAQRRAAKAEEEERKAREEREAARLEEQKAKEAAEREAERERLEAEARAKAEVERKAAENEDAQDEAEDGEEGEDDWFDDFFDSAKKAADDKLAKEKKEAEMREAAERKRKQELEIAEAKRRVEEKAQKKEMQEKGLSAMQQRLLAQKQAAEAKKKLEEEKKKALEAKKKADEEKRRAEEVKLRVEMERKKAEEESRKKQEAVKCRDLVTSKEEPLQQLQQVRTGWDQDWDCPACAGGRRDDGTAIYCHPCQAWISLSAPFDHSTFDRHCQEKDFHYNWID